MESEDKKPIFTKRLILTVLAIILIILIILLLLRRCGNGSGGGNLETIRIDVSPLNINLEPNDYMIIHAETNSNNEIYWSSLDDTCATVSPSGANPTVTAGSRECTTTIIARTADNVTTEIPVTVSKKLDKLEGLQLNKSNYIVYIGKSVLAAVTPVPTTAQLPELVYRIDDPSIATVNENGVIKGVSEGTTTLVVTTIDGSASVTATVTVKKKGSGSTTPDEETSVPTYVATTGLEFNSGNSKEVCVGSQIILGYTVKPDNATNKAVTWSVNNPTDGKGLANAYSSVDENGFLTGIAAGTTKVTIVSKDNAKLTATTTITVLAASNSKCKSGSSSSSSSSSSSGTGSSSKGSGTKEDNTGTSNNMSCRVQGVQGNNGWYKSLSVTWSYTPAPGLWSDSTHERQYCIADVCHSMPGNTYTHYEVSRHNIPSYSYKYTPADSNNPVTVTKSMTGGCKTKLTKGVDLDNPTCNIRIEKTSSGEVKLYVDAHDDNEHGSGIAKINLNNSPKKYNGEDSVTYGPVKVSLKATEQHYSAQVTDIAGRYGVCSATVTSDGALEKFEYATDVVLSSSSGTVAKNSDVSINSYIVVMTKSETADKYVSKRIGQIPSITSGSADISCSGTTCTVKPTTDTVTLELTAYDKNDKKITKKLTLRVSDSAPVVSVDKSCEKTGVAGWCRGEMKVSLNVSSLADGDKIQSKQICVGTTCGKNEVKYKEDGTHLVTYSLETQKLGKYATKKTLEIIKIDKTAPTCSAKKLAEGKYSVTFSDKVSQLDKYSINGNETILSGTSAVRTVNGSNGNTITVYDKAGNSGTCTLKDSETFKLKSINVGGGDVRIYKGKSKWVNVSYTNEDNLAVTDASVRGFTVNASNSSGCFSYTTDYKTYLNITGESEKECRGTIRITSTRDTSVNATIDVYVSATYKPSVSISPRSLNLNAGEVASITATAGTIKTANDKEDRPMKYEWSSRNKECVTVTYNGNGATVTAENVKANCTATIGVTAVYDYYGKVLATDSITVNVKTTKLAAPSISFTCGGNVYKSGDCGSNIIANASGAASGATYYYCKGENCTPSSKSLAISSSGTYKICAHYILDGVTSEMSCQNLTASINKPKPTLSIGGTKTMTSINDSVTLVATVSDGGSVISYGWKSSQSSCAAVGGTNKTATVTRKNDNDCETVITAYAYDMNYNVVAKNTATVKVMKKTTEVTASIGGNSTIESNSNTVLSAKLNDSNISVMRYEWSSGNSSCVSVTSTSSSTNTVHAVSSKDCTTTIYVKVYYNGGSQYATATKSIKVVAKSTSESDYECKIVSENNVWTKDDVTVKAACSGKDCHANQTGIQYTSKGSKVEKTYNKLFVLDKNGKSKACPTVNVYHDGVAPTCTVSGDSTVWATSRTLSITCDDKGGSGCDATYGTRNVSYKSTMKTASPSVWDRAGNRTTCPTANVYVDVTSPTISCTIATNNSENGVKVYVTASDKDSTISSADTGGTIKTTTTFSAKDKAGNSNSCTVTVTSTTSYTCPSGYSRNQNECWSTSSTKPTSCDSGYTYNSSSKKCEKTTTVHKSQNASAGNPSCTSGTVKNVNLSGGVFTYDCVTVVTASPKCKSTEFNYMGSCLTKKSLQSTRIYSGQVAK